jgi:hypothetical protein
MNREIRAANLAERLQILVVGARSAGPSDRLRRWIEIGTLVLEIAYQGRLDLARKRGPKAATLRRAKLAIRDYEASLAIGLVEVVRYAPDLAVGNLTPSHFRTVAPLAVRERVRLLRNAASSEWSIRRLRAEVDAHRHARRERKAIDR